MSLPHAGAPRSPPRGTAISRRNENHPGPVTSASPGRPADSGAPGAGPADSGPAGSGPADGGAGAAVPVPSRGPGQGVTPDRLSPITPARISPIETSLAVDTESSRATIPITAVPAAPMPVQTA